MGRLPGVLVVLVWLLATLQPAASAEVLVPDDSAISLNPHVEYLVDPGGNMTLADVTEPAQAARFQRHEGRGAINLGLTRSALWLRFRLQAPDSERQRWLLELGYFGLVDVRLHPPGGEAVITGYNEAITERPWPHRHFVFPLELAADEPATYYLRVASNGSVTAPLTLWSPDAFAVNDRLRLAALMLYFGVLGGLLIYNLFLYLYLRERQYALYCAFLVAVGAGMLVYNGFRAYLLVLLPGWPDTLGTNSLFGIAGFFGIWFLREFLSTRVEQPVVDRILLVLMGAFIIVALLPVFGVPVRVGSVGISLFGVLSGPLLLWASLRAWQRAHPGARYLLFAWGVLLLGVVVQALRNFALIPTTGATINMIQVGSLLDMLLLSFALADRIQIERRAREAAQSEALSAQRRLVEGLRASEQRLEVTVRERTEDLSQALTRERETLDQYVQFAELISHEFRNPLAIIKAQAQVAIMERDRSMGDPAQRFDTIVQAAGRLQRLFEQWLESDRLEQGQQAIERVTLDLADWLPKLLGPRALPSGNPVRLQALSGQIVADEALVGNAVVNLIDNAAKYSAAGDPIDVTVVQADGSIGIQVQDYGVGIAAAEQGRIFQRHYRAPDNTSVRGMGIGLFLVSQVMEVHGGDVTLQSAPGQGSVFTLWFPVAGESSAK